MKKILLIVAVLLFTACTTEEYIFEPTEVIFVEPNMMDSIRGFVSTVQLGTRTYNFKNDDEDENAKFVHITENLIHHISDIINIPTTRMTIFKATDDITEHRFGHGFYLTLNHDDINTYGVLTNALTNGQLPMWLSIGIELVARNATGIFEPKEIENSITIYHFPLLYGVQILTRRLST